MSRQLLVPRLALASVTICGLALAGIIATPPRVGASVRARPTAGWKILGTPNLRLRDSGLVAESCPTASFCMAIGVSGDQVTAGLVVTWNGRAWTVLPSPSASEGGSVVLDDVVCPSVDDCMVVGDFSSSSGSLEPLVWIWGGTSWKSTPFPLRRGDKFGYLGGVSCASATSCMAVGAAYDSSIEASQLTAAIWNGTSWRADSPPGASSGSDGASVSCRQMVGCVVVSDTSDGTAVSAYSWNGTDWSVHAMPRPEAVQVVGINSLACPADNFCVAVGFALSAGVVGFQPVSYTWNGTGWTWRLATKAPGSPVTDLLGVHCTSATFCVATGSYQTPPRGGKGSSTDLAISESWNGETWKLVPVPVTKGASSSYLDDVRCLSPSDCLAVGSYETADTQASLTLAESWNGHTWRALATPTPIVTLPTPLESVSCVASGACMAVGSYFGNDYQPVSESWNGSAWAVKPVPANPNAGDEQLDSVSCTSANWCVGVGVGAPGLGPEIDSWNGTTWTLQTIPAVPDAFTSDLGGVSCPTPSSCMAVGAYLGDKGEFGIADHWNGVSWHASVLPALPKGAIDAEMTSVACATATQCVAVGAYATATESFPMVAIWDGSSWHLQSATEPAGAVGTVLLSVSCYSASGCTAVGTYAGPKGKSFNLVERYDGTAWSLQTAESPSTTNNALIDISCPSAASCVALGVQVLSSTKGSALAEQSVVEEWNGSSWTLGALPEPHAALGGVSCVAAGSCMVVGSGPNGSFAASEPTP